MKKPVTFVAASGIGLAVALSGCSGNNTPPVAAPSGTSAPVVGGEPAPPTPSYSDIPGQPKGIVVTTPQPGPTYGAAGSAAPPSLSPEQEKRQENTYMRYVGATTKKARRLARKDGLTITVVELGNGNSASPPAYPPPKKNNVTVAVVDGKVVQVTPG